MQSDRVMLLDVWHAQLVHVSAVTGHKCNNQRV